MVRRNVGARSGRDQQWRGCETSADCDDSQRCEVDASARVGVCVSDGPSGNGNQATGDTDDSNEPGGGGAPTSFCTSGDEVAGTTSRALSHVDGGVAFSFDFEQVRYTAPQPCDNDLKLSLSITNRLDTTESFVYEIQVIGTGGSSNYTVTNTVFDLAPGETTEEGVIYEPQVNIRYLDFLVAATPL